MILLQCCVSYILLCTRLRLVREPILQLPGCNQSSDEAFIFVDCAFSAKLSCTDTCLVTDLLDQHWIITQATQYSSKMLCIAHGKQKAGSPYHFTHASQIR